MPMGDMTTQSVIAAFLRVMMQEITEHFCKTTVLLNEVKGAAGKLLGGGRQVELPLHVLPNTAIAGVRGDAGSWAKGGRGITSTAIVPIYPINQVGSFGHIAELRTKADVQSIRSVVEQAVKDVEIGFPLQVNKYLFLAGDGVLARVNGAPAGNVITLHAEASGLANSYGTHYMEDGMWLMGTTNTALTQENLLTDVQIEQGGVNVAANTITVTGNVAALGNNNYVTVRDGLNNVPDGLLHGIGDGVTADHGATYLNIARGANPFWRSTIKNMAGAGVIETTLLGVLMNVEKLGEEIPDMAICEFEGYNKLWQEAKATRTFFSNITNGLDKNSGAKYALGFNRIQIGLPNGNIEIFADRHCPMGEWFGFRPKDLAFVHVDGKAPLGGWYTSSDGSMFHEIPGTFRKEIVWLSVFNFIVKRPRACYRLSGVPRVALI